MEKSISVFLTVFFISVNTCINCAFGQQKPLSSEALYSKKHGYSSFPVAAGEKYLVLNKAPQIGKFRRYRFLIKDEINFRIKNDKKRYKNSIVSISDSSFTVAFESVAGTEYKEVMLHDVSMFKISKRIPFVSEAAYYLPLGGLVYISADFFNKGIDGQRFTTDASAFIVGGTLMVAGLVCYKLSSGTIKISDRNRLEVLTSY